jgi:hypothetical protein
VVLVIALIMLVVLTMIGLSSTRISSLEILMGVNSEDSVESLALAEDAVLAGEQRIENDFNGAPNIDLTVDTDDGLYLDENLVIDTLDWSTLKTELADRTGEPDRVYIVEYIGPRIVAGRSLALGVGAVGDTRYLYRVSGHGDSDRGSARVVQTIYALRAL